MSRPLRLEYEGALYHVTSRGNERNRIYFEDRDFELFLDILGIVCDRFNWVIHAYCLMSNHYHLLVETPDGNLSRGMRHLNGVYTQDINRRHSRVGHLFQGRYKAILVDRESYLLELSRYIVLNPVRARMVDLVSDWAWSSYHQTIGAEDDNRSWLAVDPMLLQFSTKRESAVRLYKAFVANGVGASIWDKLNNQLFLGDDSFVNRHQCYLSRQDGDLNELPVKQRRKVPKSLEEYFGSCETKENAIYTAYSSGGYTQKEIADHLGVHYSTVSRAIARCKT